MKKKLVTIILAVMLCLVGGTYDFTFDKGIQAEESAAYAATINKPTIKVKASGIEGLKISWEKVSGAKKYYIYRSTNKGGSYEKIAETTKASYTDKKIDQNKTYYYKVKAANGKDTSNYSSVKSSKINTIVKLSNIPEYSGAAYVTVNDNVPKFSERMKREESSESYSKLDSLGRCGTAYACIGVDLMPTDDRESIGMVQPAGWDTVRYDDLIEDKYLYNRCHLIGYQLTGENANEKNLITGTRYLNVDGMLPFENKVANYIKSTGNHVLYRVTPLYDGEDLLCQGVQIEAYSVEDEGEGISFNVFVYNVQPGVEIDYSNGDSWRSGEEKPETITVLTPAQSIDKSVNKSTATTGGDYVLNTNSKKIHYPSCSSVKDMKDTNKKETNESRDALIAQGYEPCKRCNP